MGSTTLAEAPNENPIIRFKEDYLDCMSAFPQSRQDLLQGTKELPLPNVDDKRNSIDPLFRMGAEIRHRGDQGRRKIINAKDTKVFQRLDRLALPCT